MARTVTWRTAVAILAIVALATTACGKNEPSSQAPGPQNGGALGGAPPASTTPTAGSTPTRGGGGGTSGPTYPKSARTYSQEFLRAWGSRNFTRLEQLGDVGAVQQVRDSANTGGIPNSQWTHIRCGPAEQMPGHTACLFRNAHGDETVLELVDAKLGSPKAVTKAPLDRTRYPAGPEAYAEALLAAYRKGNVQRVLRLSNSVVRGKLTCTLEGGWTTNPAVPADGTYSNVLIAGLGPEIGKSYTFKVLSQPEGKPNGVKEATNNCGS